MAENVYEGMFILDSNRYSRDPAGVSGQIPKTITEHGGTMLASRLWEERRLAYPVNGHKKGTYWLTYFRLDPKQLVDVRRQFQLNEAVLRMLFLKVEPRIADTLVQHALSGAGPVERSRAKDEEGPKRVAIEVPEIEEIEDV